MKKLPILFAVLILAACQPKEAAYPTDLKGQKALLSQKKSELSQLKQLIAQLEGDIAKVEPPKEKSRILVTTMDVKKSNFERYIDLQAAIEAEDMVAASSETGGRLTAVKVSEGDYVKKGQLIATVDLEQVNKQIAELEKSLELAQEVYERQKRLWDQNIGSEIQYLQAKNNKERLEKSLETVRFQLTKGNVYAPKSGVVEMLIAKTGEMAGPGTPIAQILNTSRVKAAADVPEKFLRDVRKGERMSIEIPALEMETKGRVTSIGSTINPSNRTFKVEVELPNSKGLLKPNLLAKMLLKDFAAKDVITIPIELVQQEVSGKDYVLVSANSKNGLIAEKRYVTTGESYEGTIIISEGLEVGDLVINDGARGLASGSPIKILENKEG